MSSSYLPPEHLGVNALYGAYWYCKGLEEGRKRYEHVKEWAEEQYHEFNEDPKASYPVTWNGPDEWALPDSPMKVLLKKGCTEFERTVGPSDKWHEQTKTLEHQILMQLIEDNIVWHPLTVDQPPIVHHQTITMWIEWAYGHGDITYKEFTGGNDLYPGYVTYHDEDGAETAYSGLSVEARRALPQAPQRGIHRSPRLRYVCGEHVHPEWGDWAGVGYPPSIIAWCAQHEEE